MMSILPDLKDIKPYKQALEEEQAARAELEAARELVQEAADAVQEADADCADHSTLKQLKEATAAAERAQELAERELDAAMFNSKEQRKAAEEAIKNAAADQGKKITKRVLNALVIVENAQLDYTDLAQELRQKVSWPRPHAEGPGHYAGPDPAAVYNPMDFKAATWKKEAEKFTTGKKEKPEPKRREVELPGELILS